ncbi:MAG: flavin reductase family protein [Propionicimonas sp.]|uniref:flavin reductase family protein n=1 Tax=Propionicimonas sp. TaxID=1955623 RepID=UPI003D0A0464
MTIHYTNPFADPPSARDAVRAFRGRLASGVTLWTAAGERKPAGLTVSSLMVANGTPPRVLALLDPLADLTDALLASGRAAVTILDRDQVRLAGAFAGTDPAPGGPFRQVPFSETDWGPVPDAAGTWAGLQLESSAEVGWSVLVTCVVQHLVTDAAGDPLVHYRGGYPRLEVDGPR